MFDAKKVKDACVQWIRDWFEENGPGCNAVLGISGGKDSSVCAALSLFCLTEKMRSDPSIAWQLSADEQITLKLYWAMQVIRDGRHVMDHLMQTLFGNK